VFRRGTAVMWWSKELHAPGPPPLPSSSSSSSLPTLCLRITDQLRSNKKKKQTKKEKKNTKTSTGEPVGTGLMVSIFRPEYKNKKS